MINIKEFVLFLKESKLLGDEVTELEGKQIFAAVNLDDDLYVAESVGDSSADLVFQEFGECLIRLAVEKQRLDDGSSLRSWVTEALAGGEAHVTEKEELAAQINDFICNNIAPFADTLITREILERFDRRAKMTWHQLQLEKGDNPKKAVKMMKELARQHVNQYGTINVTHATLIWKQCVARLGLSDCPPQKVFAEFLASFKP